jgi:hypothetical protein
MSTRQHLESKKDIVANARRFADGIPALAPAAGGH